MSRALTERGFSGSPALLGEIVRVGSDGKRYTMAIVQQFVENQGDGWAWSISQLERLVDEHAAPLGDDAAPKFRTLRGIRAHAGHTRRQMHAALAHATDNVDFKPEVATAEEATEWVAQVRNELEHALSVLDRATGLSDTETGLVRELEGRRGHLLDIVAQLAQEGVGSIRTRVHGDLHLGQVLVAGGDVQIIDFEGEPRKTMAQRRAKASRCVMSPA